MSNALVPFGFEIQDLEEKPDISDVVWRQKDGTPIRLGDMDDNHLRNTALMLIGMGYQTYRTPDYRRARWLVALQTEWRKRMLERNNA